MSTNPNIAPPVSGPPLENEAISSNVALEDVTSKEPNKSETLVFALPLDDAGMEYRYAVVPLPKNYTEAMTTAIRVFGNHLLDPNPDHIILRKRILLKNKDQVWSDIDPANWHLMVSGNDEVAVCKNRAILEHFTHGKVLLLFGKKDARRAATTWRLPEQDSRTAEINEKEFIDRPISYQDAVKSVKIWAAERGQRWQDSQFQAWTAEYWNTRSDKVKFFIHTGSSWTEMPPNTRTDSKRWRLSVPGPKGRLAFIIDD